MDELLYVLQRLSVLNRDNGSAFTNTQRLDAIASLLSDSPYHRIEAKGLFHLYGQKSVSKLKGPVVIVSSHVDCESHITRCFASLKDKNTLLGTFDNSITNAAIVSLMRSIKLPENVFVAFTGDEEENGRGAKDLIRFIRKKHLDVVNITVLDVTEEGWKTNADFTVENDFWDEEIGEAVVALVEKTGYRWNFVPGELDDIPDYIPKNRVIHVEAYDDESWDYDEKDLPCFSFCLPSSGEMHSDDGILVRTDSFRRYTEVLGRILKEISLYF